MSVQDRLLREIRLSQVLWPPLSKPVTYCPPPRKTYYNGSEVEQYGIERAEKLVFLSAVCRYPWSQEDRQILIQFIHGKGSLTERVERILESIEGEIDGSCRETG